MASFCVDVGSDLYGQKHNVQLRLNGQPSVSELCAALCAAVESYFDTKSRACRPAGYPDQPFKVETFQVFDDTLMRWGVIPEAQTETFATDAGATDAGVPPTLSEKLRS
eukprot:gene18219-16849_t